MSTEGRKNSGTKGAAESRKRHFSAPKQWLTGGAIRDFVAEMREKHQRFDPGAYEGDSRSGAVKRSSEDLGREAEIAHRDAKKRKKMSSEDQDAVVCLFLEVFDLHNVSCDVGSLHWYDGEYAEFKSEIRAKWGGDDQTPDKSFSAMFRRGRELFEARFPDEVASLRDAGLVMSDAVYDDFKTPYPTEDDERDRRDRTYDAKALLCFFMEVFDAQRQEDAATHWTEGRYEDLKASIDPSWVGEDGGPNAKFTRMTERGLDIVEKAFSDAFQRLRAHDMMYRPGVFY